MSFQSHFHLSRSVASSSVARALLRPKSCHKFTVSINFCIVNWKLAGNARKRSQHVEYGLGGPHNPPFQFTLTWYFSVHLQVMQRRQTQTPQLLWRYAPTPRLFAARVVSTACLPPHRKAHQGCGPVSLTGNLNTVLGTKIIRHLVTSDYFSRRWFYLKVQWFSSVVWISKHYI